jgi:uncharacterized protein (TIGR02246 family)
MRADLLPVRPPGDPMSVLRRLAAVACCVLLAACPAADGSTDTAADEQAIRATLDSWNQALSSANDSLLASYYAEDASMMPPGMPKVSGRANIRAFWASLWPMKATLAMSPSTFAIAGDLAVEEGTWIWSVPVNGGIQQDHGKYLHTWRRVDGTWVIVQNIWNSDLAPAVAEKVVSR